MLPRSSWRLQNMDPDGVDPHHNDSPVVASAPDGVAMAPLLRRDSRWGYPLVLQVSAPPDSNEPDEFFYDALANVQGGNFVAARAFFIRHGHTVVYHECPLLATFQTLFPGAAINSLSSLPVGLPLSCQKDFYC